MKTTAGLHAALCIPATTRAERPSIVVIPSDELGYMNKDRAAPAK